MTERPEDEVIVTLVVRLAHALGLTVVAEGIESDTQRRQLARLGCEHGQGFLFGRSLTADAAQALVAKELAGTLPGPSTPDVD